MELVFRLRLAAPNDTIYLSRALYLRSNVFRLWYSSTRGDFFIVNY